MAKNYQKFTKIKYVQENMWNIWLFLGNKLKGWSHKLETLHEDKVGPILKKARKQQIYGGSASLWISRLKITNISQIFAYPILEKNIGIQFSRAMFNRSSQLYSHPFLSMFELQLILWQFLLLQKTFSTRTQIQIESETAKEKTSKYFHLKFWLEKMGAKVIILANS